MVAALAGAGLNACDVTNVQPQNAIPENDVYSNAGRVALAVTGIFNAAHSGFYAPLNGDLAWPCAAIRSALPLIPSTMRGAKTWWIWPAIGPRPLRKATS